MTDVGRALEQIAEIRDHLAKGEVYRGWRSVPVACSGLIGIGAAAWQTADSPTRDAASFVRYWLAVGAVALLVGCSEIAWRYAARATAEERSRARRVLGQFLPALIAAAMTTSALVGRDRQLVSLLPGLWALFFGVGIFATRPNIPRASQWVALYYWGAGVALLWFRGTPVSPWAVGGTFGAGQLLAAAVLYWSLERDPCYAEQEA